VHALCSLAPWKVLKLNCIAIFSTLILEPQKCKLFAIYRIQEWAVFECEATTGETRNALVLQADEISKLTSLANLITLNLGAILATIFSLSSLIKTKKNLHIRKKDSSWHSYAIT